MIHPFGGLTGVDADTIEKALHLASSIDGDKDIVVVEIGTFSGETARGIKNCIEALGRAIQYWGVDNGTQSSLEPPFEGAKMIRGDSAEVFHLLPENIHFLFIDGCHCGNHVILDTIHYGARVRPKGLMAFHDTDEKAEHTMKDPHGPDIPWFYNSVNAAHRKMGFPGPAWVKVLEAFDSERNFGGVTVYQKV